MIRSRFNPGRFSGENIPTNVTLLCYGFDLLNMSGNLLSVIYLASVMYRMLQNGTGTICIVHSITISSTGLCEALDALFKDCLKLPFIHCSLYGVFICLEPEKQELTCAPVLHLATLLTWSDAPKKPFFLPSHAVRLIPLKTAVIEPTKSSHQKLFKLRLTAIFRSTTFWHNLCQS